MRLPPIDNSPSEWPQGVIVNWTRLLERAQHLEGKAGGSDAFERMLATFREMVRTGRFDGFKPLLAKRLAARALTWLWLHDEVIGPRLLNVQLLNTLTDAQQPRLTRITLVQLIQMYFRHFDHLDERDKTAEQSLRAVVEAHVQAQLRLLPEPRMPSLRPDALTQLKQHGHWLLGPDGPLALAKQVREQGSELAATFEAYGLAGLDTGRYGDICRAHFYLETLRGLAPGEWDEVLAELLKPSVSKAPYEGDKRIGHAALEILIDRAGAEPGDAWQNFILNLAGDPRIASSSPNFRQWWLPLGEERISQVRGWLSKEDLRLFLQAVEQYGIETKNTELQRMFPARKTFLEGLFKLKLIRNTRLLLGRTAQQTVKKILGSEVKTSFAHMEGSMGDKAVIYLDCGDFHLVEGSHSFKIWVYLAAPGEALRSYDKNTFSHADLISTIPGQYKKLYPTLPYEAIVHTPNTWQHKVFQFLAGNGIGLDIEQLLSKQDYKLHLSKHGVPAVSRSKVKVPLALQSSMPTFSARPVQPGRLSESLSSASEAASHTVRSTASRPLTGPQMVGEVGVTSVANSIRAQNKAIADADYTGDGRVSADVPGAGIALTPDDSTSSTVSPKRPLSAPTRFLPDAAWELLAYFNDHPLSQMREAAKALGIGLAEANQLRGRYLTGLCLQEATQFGWTGWKVNAAGEAVLHGGEQPLNLPSSSGSVAEDRDSIHIGDGLPEVEPVAAADVAITPTPENELSGSALAGSITRLPASAIAVLRYFASNPGDKARYASNVLDIEVREINRLLHGPLSTFCQQDASFGWRVSGRAVVVLDKLFP